MQDILTLIQSILVFLSNQNMAILVLVYIFSNILFSVLFLPCSIFALTAGLIWGIWPGLIISQIATMISSLILFNIGKKLKSKSLPKILENSKIIIKIKKIMKNAIDGSHLSVLAFQMNPLIPASSFSLFFGATKISSVKFMLLTYISTLPLQIILVSIGATVFDIVFMNQIKYYTTLGLIAFSIVLSIILLRRNKNNKTNKQLL
jgi:uncharacterized membrane protein YdjX (TVP38/TMEM64 family)